MYKIALIVTILLCGNIVFSQTVDIDLALKVAENFYENTYKNGYRVKDSIKYIKTAKRFTKNISTKQYKGHNSYYIVNFENGGWAIISSHKALGPVLAHSPEGSLEESELPPVFAEWMLQYEERIDSAYQFNWRKITKDKKWKDFEDGNFESASIKSARTNVPGGFYLLDTEWGQSQTNDNHCPSGGAYNAYMPISNCTCGQRQLAGCVAVAIGQIMNYWKFATGDYADFEWWNMPDKLYYSGNNSFNTNRNAISYLLKRCGDRVSMNWGCDESGADTQNGIYAFSKFGYVEESMDYERKSWHTYNAWVNKLKHEINNGRPILYRYVGKHAFVCDGYGDGNQFHFNLGWNGIGDGFYDFEDLYPAGQNFTNISNHHCIIGIKPNKRSLQSLKNLTINSPDKKTYQALNIIASDNSNVNINSGADCHLIASQNILLLPGFQVQSGGTFEARILPDSPWINARLASDLLRDEYFEPDETISNNLIVYPNPTQDGKFNISSTNILNEKMAIVELFDIMGNKIKSMNYDVSLNNIIDISYTPNGVYIVKILLNNKTTITKLLKN